MHTIISFVLILIALLAGSCAQNTTDPPPQSTASLTATPSSVRVLPGSDGIVTVSGGTTPDSIVGQPNASVATALINNVTVTIRGVGIGTTSVRVGDSSTPQKMVTIGVTVATSAVAILVLTH